MEPNNVNHIQKQAEQKLLSLLYQGEKKNWEFKLFVTAHKENHTILEGLTDHGYCVLDARMMVTRILDGMKTDSLEDVKENIVQDRKLHKDFERCVTF